MDPEAQGWVQITAGAAAAVVPLLYFVRGAQPLTELFPTVQPTWPTLIVTAVVGYLAYVLVRSSAFRVPVHSYYCAVVAIAVLSFMPANGIELGGDDDGVSWSLPAGEDPLMNRDAAVLAYVRNILSAFVDIAVGQAKEGDKAVLAKHACDQGAIERRPSASRIRGERAAPSDC
jgi:hypothetical protein